MDTLETIQEGGRSRELILNLNIKRAKKKRKIFLYRFAKHVLVERLSGCLLMIFCCVEMREMNEL